MGTVHDQSGLNWEVPLDREATVIFFGTLVKYVSPQKLEMGSRSFRMPVSVYETAESVLIGFILEDREAGREDLIAEVRVNALMAAQLYHEGLITLEMLQAAEETPETIAVEISLAGKPRKVVVYDDVAPG